jgi:8-oxo-dGTP diphosphatase
MKLFVAAKAIVERSDGKVLIVRESGEYDEGTNEGKWDVVGGRLDAGEPLLEGLQREVREESGLEVVVNRVVTVNDKFQVIKGEDVHIIRVYYLCRAQGEQVVLSADHDRYEWVTPNDYEEYGILEDVKEVLRLV